METNQRHCQCQCQSWIYIAHKRKASNALVREYKEKRWVFRWRLKEPVDSAVSLMLSGSAFQAIGPATEKARRPNCVRRWRGTLTWLHLAERRCCLLAISETGVQRSVIIAKNRYTIVFWCHRVHPSQQSSVTAVKSANLHAPARSSPASISDIGQITPNEVSDNLPA